MLDPSLTPLGEEQCQQLAEKFPYHESVELLVASPLRRTIYTALRGFEGEVKRGIQVIALAWLQETSDLPCDTGSDIETLKREMEGKPVDLSLLAEGWDDKKGLYAANEDAIDSRAKLARQWLKARPEKEIVVVTHGGYLHFLTEDWTESGKFMGDHEIFDCPDGSLR